MSAGIPEGLRTDNPPEDPRKQILAWAIEEHLPFRCEAIPRWMIVQWRKDFPHGGAAWTWSVPGYSTHVKVLGWMPLPALDLFGEHGAATYARYAAREREWASASGAPQ